MTIRGRDLMAGKHSAIAIAKSRNLRGLSPKILA